MFSKKYLAILRLAKGQMCNVEHLLKHDLDGTNLTKY